MSLNEHFPRWWNKWSFWLFKQKSLLWGNKLQQKLVRHWNFSSTQLALQQRNMDEQKRKNPGLCQQTLQCIFRRCPCHRWTASSHLKNTWKHYTEDTSYWSILTHTATYTTAFNRIKQTVELDLNGAIKLIKNWTSKICDEKCRKLPVLINLTFTYSMSLGYNSLVRKSCRHLSQHRLSLSISKNTKVVPLLAY